MRNLKIVLVAFFATYFLRWLSDNWMVPYLLDTENLVICVSEGEKDICASFALLLFYTWTTAIWDFLPIFLIMWFHHHNFKTSRRSGRLDTLSTANSAVMSLNKSKRTKTTDSDNLLGPIMTGEFAD